MRARSVRKPAGSYPGAEWGVPCSRDRRAAREAIIREKLGSALLPAMRAAGVDMWIVLDRENAPDPLRDDLGGGSPGWGAAFVFWDDGSRVEKIHLSAARQPLDSPIECVFDLCLVEEPSREAFARALRGIVERRHPRRIAVNESETIPAADGLTVSGRRFLVEALGDGCAALLVPSDVLVHRFRAARTRVETTWYRRLQEWTSRWLGEALAGQVRAGATAREVADWCEDRARELGFLPLADHGRYPLIVWLGSRASMLGVAGSRETPIEEGDLVTLDGGLRVLGLSSDMKRSGYVLRADEREAPANLREGWRRMLEAAQIFAAHLRAGTTSRGASREIGAALAAAGFAVDSAGIEGAPRIVLYGHAVGNHVHEVGARLRLPPAPTDADCPILNGEWISVEFHVVAAGDRQHPWYLRFEQTGQVRAGGFEWLAPLQHDLVLIKPGRRGASRAARRPSS